MISKQQLFERIAKLEAENAELRAGTTLNQALEFMLNLSEHCTAAVKALADLSAACDHSPNNNERQASDER